MADFQKIRSILKLRELGLPAPETVFINDLETQKNKLNNFLLDKEFVMIRSDSKKQSTHCPRKLKCSKQGVQEFIRELNQQGFIAIVQEHVPLNNRYSGNLLMLNDSFIIEAMKGGPVSKLNREGVIHEHLRLDLDGNIISRKGEQVIPRNELTAIINEVRDLPVKHHILEFSSGPDWFYFWQAREDKTSELLD